MSEVNERAFTFQTSSIRKKYALVMGVNGSSAMESVQPLLFAESDAVGLCWLLEREGCNFVFPTKGLIGEGGTAVAVRFAISKMINQSSDGDLLLFYFLCHSHQIVKRDQSVETFLVTADFNPELAQHIPDAYLSLSTINGILSEENIEGRDIIIVLDCCEVGNIIDPLKFDQQVAQLLRAESQKPQLESEPLWEIIASTNRDSPTFEYRGHLVMTGLVLAALEGKAREALNAEGHLTTHSLYDYLQNQVNREKSGKHLPRIRGNFSGRQWVLAENPAREPIKTSPQAFPLQPELIEQTFDMTPCNARLDDLDFEQITRFLQNQRVLLQDDYHPHFHEAKSMEGMGFLHNGRPTYATLLCYGRKPTHFVVGAYTRCVCWLSDSQEKGWKEEYDCRGGLLDQFNAACRFLKKHLGNTISSSQEIEVGKIPFRVLHEALVNALVHREYTVEPDHRLRLEGIQVDIYRDRVNITSPGKLPPEISLEELKSGRDRPGLCYPRNPQIMRIFYLAGYVVWLGTGIARMRRLMDAAGLVLEVEEQTHSFTVTLYLASYKVKKPKNTDESSTPSTALQSSLLEHARLPGFTKLGPLEVFCCYAREDREMLIQLKKHLAPLQKQGLITIWSDIDLGAGTDWEKTLHQHLESADIILLLISADFMNSDYCYSTELRRAIERHDQGDAMVIPVLLRSTFWQNAPFAKLQMAPTDAKPVTGWSDRDEAFYDIVTHINRVVSNLRILRRLSMPTDTKENFEKHPDG